MPKVTIVVPVYKVEAYLKRCVDSILAQTFQDFQLILVNDGSPDRSPDICDEYARKDKRIQVIHKENGGLTSARLAGFQMAKGEFISFIDSDDYIDRFMIEKLYSACIETNADLSICGYYTVLNNKVIAYCLPFNKKVIQKSEITDDYILPIIGRIFTKGYINLPGFLCIRLFKNSILNDDCFLSEREFFTEDDLFNLIIAPKCQKIAIVNTPFYYYWQTMQSLTNSYRTNAWKMLLKRYDFCLDYCRKYMLSDKAKDRLDFNLFGSLCFCIENACKTNDMDLAASEIEGILNHLETVKLLKRINISLMTKRQKILYFLCRCKMCRLLYGYKRLKMCR